MAHIKTIDTNVNYHYQSKDEHVTRNTIVRDNEEVTDISSHIRTRSTHRRMATVILEEPESNQLELTWGYWILFKIKL